eukprot:maker-scaffold150_size309978-snap-gene-1.12 protein:Tk09110 transcript:maker-scaffold150_size309978-snap-gene-1.12-mRNA-1 annotation:"muscle-specific protein 300"
MTFWQENFSFIKDVYESRSSKLIELMDKTDKAMGAVLADKIYTSNEFKKVKEVFAGLARNLEQPDTKEWLTVTKDTLLSDRPNEQDDESKKLQALLDRFDSIMPRIDDTKKAVDCLWKAYQFTDELAPYMEFMEDLRSKSSREIVTNAANETEDHIDKHEKCMDQMDKKRKSILDQLAKGEKILADPKSPKFLEGHVNKMKTVWEDAQKTASDRLAALKDNLHAWDRYDKTRDSVGDKLGAAEAEFKKTHKIFDLSTTSNDYAQRFQTAGTMKKDIEESFNLLSNTHTLLSKFTGEFKKNQLADEVKAIKTRMSILDRMDERLTNLDDFIKRLKAFDVSLKELEKWNAEGRTRMNELLNPPKPLLPEERVMYTMELQSDVEVQLDKHRKHGEEWDQIKPTEGPEKTDEAEAFVKRLEVVNAFLGQLLEEVKNEGEKFGEDIKYLADFTSGCKKFEPWIGAAEVKKKAGMHKPKNLDEAKASLTDAQKWKQDSDQMKAVLDAAHTSAQKMTLHDEPDLKHDINIKRWQAIDAAAQDWIRQLQAMVEVWQKQADTAAKVSAAIAADPADGAPEMNLEDLEKHLNSLKQMFIEKQKMMAQLEKSGGDAPAPTGSAPSPVAAAPPAADPAPVEAPAPSSPFEVMFILLHEALGHVVETSRCTWVPPMVERPRGIKVPPSLIQGVEDLVGQGQAQGAQIQFKKVWLKYISDPTNAPSNLRIFSLANSF